MEIVFAGFAATVFLLMLAAGIFFVQAVFVIDPLQIRKRLQAGRMAQMQLSARLMAAQKVLRYKNDDLERMAAEVRGANLDLNRLNELKTKFFHIVTHEIRNPLGIISGFSQMLTMQLTEGLSDEQLTSLNNINKASQRANVLLNDLTDLVAIESGKFKVQLKTVDLGELLRNALPSLEYVTRKRGVGLEIECAPALPATLADENRITQVFINLVTNSCKFTEPGGKIRIAISLAAGDQGPEFLVLIQDTGAGFDPEESEKIFERFYQAKNQDLATQKQGFGLGLFIVSEILKSHQGSIRAHSEGLGKGAAFTIRMPVLVQEEKEHE